MSTLTVFFVVLFYFFLTAFKCSSIFVTLWLPRFPLTIAFIYTKRDKQTCHTSSNQEMLLQLGQGKSLCAPPTIPMELGTGKKIEPADPKQWGLQTDSKQMRSCSCHQQFPTWNLGKDSKQIWNCRPNHQQFPVWNLGTNQQLGFSAQVGELWSEPRARGLGSGWNHLVAQADLCQIGKSIRSGAWHREWSSELRRTYSQPLETTRETQNSKEFSGTMPTFPVELLTNPLKV